MYDHYSVMQSDGNSFCGNVIFVIFNMVYCNEYRFKTKIMQSKSFGMVEEYAYLKKYST